MRVVAITCKFQLLVRSVLMNVLTVSTLYINCSQSFAVLDWSDIWHFSMCRSCSKVCKAGVRKPSQLPDYWHHPARCRTTCPFPAYHDVNGTVSAWTITSMYTQQVPCYLQVHNLPGMFLFTDITFSLISCPEKGRLWWWGLYILRARIMLARRAFCPWSFRWMPSGWRWVQPKTPWWCFQ